MRGYVVWGMSVGAMLLAVACGKKDDAGGGSGPGAEPVAWVANVTPGVSLGGELWAKNAVDLNNNCFQVVQSTQDASKRGVRVSTERCPDSSLATALIASYELHEYIDPDKIGKPTNLFVLYHQYLPVGLIEKNPDGYLLKDFCTLDAMFTSSCSLKLAEGRVTGVIIQAAAPQLRVARELKLNSQAQELRAQLADSKSSLAKTIADVADKQKTIGEQRKAVALILLAQEGQLKQLIEILGQTLEGQADAVGYKGKLADVTETIKKLQADIEARAASLKQLEDGVLAARAKTDTLKKQIAELSGKRGTLAGAELDKLLIEIGAAAGALLDEEDNLKLLIAEREASEIFREDERDRKALEKAKRTSVLLSQLVEVTLESISKARASLLETGNSLQVLKDGKTADAIATVPKLCQNMDRIGQQLERLQALSLSLKMN